jgi:DNA-binding CsgD family transcriptional regulator
MTTVESPRVITEPELDVLRLVADGHTNASIGEDLYLTINGVRARLMRIYDKLGARDRAHAVSIGYRIGLLQ